MYLKQQKDSDLVLKFDDDKEITGWEVVNTKTRMDSEEQLCECCQAARAASNAASNATSNTTSRNSYP